ncbi:MAG: hypothetical protein K0Q97_2382 [Bacillota bacterium]|nr:hypothetical protein [Bacillota bacterium]
MHGGCTLLLVVEELYLPIEELIETVEELYLMNTNLC